MQFGALLLFISSLTICLFKKKELHIKAPTISPHWMLKILCLGEIGCVKTGGTDLAQLCQLLVFSYKTERFPSENQWNPTAFGVMPRRL
jgi:hypothetical protein